VSARTRELRSKVAGLSRRQPERAAEARRELKHAKAEEYIKRLIEEAPPLTAAQRDHLARLLRTGNGDLW
jgi:hypothetical protein